MEYLKIKSVLSDSNGKKGTHKEKNNNYVSANAALTTSKHIGFENRVFLADCISKEKKSNTEIDVQYIRF